MAKFWEKELPSKKKDYIEYLDLEWNDLAWEMNLTEETLQNIVIEVEQDQPRLEWLKQRGAALNLTQRDMDPVPIVYI